jgi:hypothetical protein
VKKDGYEIWIRNERKIVLSRAVLFKPDITQNESMCPTLHVAPTKVIVVLNNYTSDDGNTASNSGGIVRIQKFMFKTKKAYAIRNSPIG